MADFLKVVYLKLKDQAFESRVLNADETPHRMLEGDEKKSWFLWGFSTPEVIYFECHDSRSGDVPKEILIKSRCEFC